MLCLLACSSRAADTRTPTPGLLPPYPPHSHRCFLAYLPSDNFPLPAKPASPFYRRLVPKPILCIPFGFFPPPFVFRCRAYVPQGHNQQPTSLFTPHMAYFVEALRLQAGRSWVGFPMESLEFFSHSIL